MDEWRPVISQTSFDKSLSLVTFDDELLRLGLTEEATVGDVRKVETVVECWVRAELAGLSLLLLVLSLLLLVLSLANFLSVIEPDIGEASRLIDVADEVE